MTDKPITFRLTEHGSDSIYAFLSNARWDGSESVTFHHGEDEPKTRTPKQNSSLWDYLTCLASAMDEAGLDMRQVITLPIKPTKDNVMELMGRKVLEKLYPSKISKKTGKVSTAGLSTVEMMEFYEVLNAATGSRLGISLDWPNKDNGGKC